jgi:DNA-binding transcriptional regulator LsrR (DeoR family)
MRNACAAILCSAALLLAGCGSANAPQTASGVRAMYRSIGLDASSGAFTDICRSYMDAQLRTEVERANDNCTTSSSTSRLERWAEKIRASKIRPGTRIAISGGQALVYDGAKPERALYTSGQWQLAEAPELTSASSSR